MAGSAILFLDGDLHPGQLKDQVCSPAGTTIRGVAALEEAGVRSAFIKAVDAALKK
jgi:pyrroline-5-carboxylate reductase